MKIDKFNIDGKKESIEVMDKIFSAKINKIPIKIIVALVGKNVINEITTCLANLKRGSFTPPFFLS